MSDEVAARRELAAAVWRHYCSSLTDWCNHEIALARAAEHAGCTTLTARHIIEREQRKVAR
jgi:hypothetical protein